MFDIKNQEQLIKFMIFSIIFVSVLGTLLHFTFEWSRGNLLVGAFSAVNESSWEHLKLLFFPMLITTIIGYFYISKDIYNFLCSRVFGIISALLFIIIFFSLYTGILSTNIAFLNIASFFIAVTLGEYISYKLTLSHFACSNTKAVIFLVLLLFCFIFFTYFPPQIRLFKDPVTSSYGIAKL